MIAELFYPKELKEIIADLRAKDDLNEEALKNIDKAMTRQRFSMIIVSFFAFAAFIYILPSPEAYLLLLAAVFFLIFSLMSPFNLNIYILPYANGAVTSGRVLGAHYDIIPAHGYYGWSIRYEFSDSSGHIIKSSAVGIKKEDVRNEKVREGDSLKIFYLEDDPAKNAPFFSSMYKRYSLRKIE